MKKKGQKNGHAHPAIEKFVQLNPIKINFWTFFFFFLTNLLLDAAAFRQLTKFMLLDGGQGV